MTMALWVVVAVGVLTVTQALPSPFDHDGTVHAKNKRQLHGGGGNLQTTSPPANDPMTAWLQQASRQKPNVLFLIVDDLRPKLGCYGDSNMITPNIDHLASVGVLFHSAYSQQAVCGPSRTSFMTGRRPDTTRVTNLHDYWRTVAGNFTTLSQYFKQHGYMAHGIGKIYHPGTSSGDDYDYPYSWSDPFNTGDETLNYGVSHGAAVRAVSETGGKLLDTDIADDAVQWLHDHARQGNQPFFLAVGFHKPHLPFIFPREYLDLYPLSNIHLAAHRQRPTNVPDYTWTSFPELRKYHDIEALHLQPPDYYIPDNMQMKLRQGYSAAVSYVDALVGRVLEALEQNNFDRNTIIAFVGDHGWQLGENDEWGKHNNYDVTVRTPMIMHVPGVTSTGHNLHFIDSLDPNRQHQQLNISSKHSTSEVVELVDLFPTLSELAGLPVPSTCPQNSLHVLTCTEGTSLVPLIRSVRSEAHGTNYTVKWKDAAYSQFPRGSDRHPIMGYTMRSGKYRYTEWVSYDKQHFRPNFNQVLGKELYDHDVDPEESNNLAGDAAHHNVLLQLSAKLHGGWRQTLARYNSQ